MKVSALIIAASLMLAPAAALAGEEERNTQNLGNLPNEALPPLTNIPSDATAAAGAGLAAAALIGGSENTRAAVSVAGLR